MLDQKDAFHLLRLSETQNDIVEYYHTLAAHHIYIKECIRLLYISPSIWQSYINAILDCLHNRKYCEAIKDDLLLFTPSKKSHVAN